MGLETVSVMAVFCVTYRHLLMILGDDEFYEKQEPFRLEQQRAIAATLNTLVFNSLVAPHPSDSSSSAAIGRSPDVPLLLTTAALCLRALYERDCRRPFCPPLLWRAPAAKASALPTPAAARAHMVAANADVALEGGASGASMPMGVARHLSLVPHVLPFEQRVHIFRELVGADKARLGIATSAPPAVLIVVHRASLVEDAFLQLNALGPRLKSRIGVTFVNAQGLQEAGLDHGGLSKELLTDLSRATFDPQRGLFAQTDTEEGLLYPHPGAASMGLAMMEFCGRIVGKALYEGFLLDLSFAPLFVSKLLNRNSYLDELSSLDKELHRNLLYLKHYEGDATDLSLDFTVTEELFGKRTVIELRPGGADIPVTNENKLQYIYAVANYKLNVQMRSVTRAFLQGLHELISPTWLRLFSEGEFNQLLSGGQSDIDIEDLRANTIYSGGYSASSRTVKLFWEVVAGFEPAERCALLKFVTSCARGPLLGFKHLQPPFTIHKVECETSIFAAIGGQDADRLPSASTCYNMLKLPTYKRASTLREKMKYAIKAGVGFELS